MKSWNNVENPCSARIAVWFGARQFLAGQGNSRPGYDVSVMTCLEHK